MSRNACRHAACPKCSQTVDLDQDGWRYLCIWCKSHGSQSQLNWSYRMTLTVCKMGTSQLETIMAYDEIVKQLVGISARKYAEVKRYYPQLDIRLEEKLIGCCMTVSFKKSWAQPEMLGSNGLDKDAVVEKVLKIHSPREYQPLFAEKSGEGDETRLKRRRLSERQSFVSARN